MNEQTAMRMRPRHREAKRLYQQCMAEIDPWRRLIVRVTSLGVRPVSITADGHLTYGEWPAPIRGMLDLADRQIAVIVDKYQKLLASNYANDQDQQNDDNDGRPVVV
jgi:hypothetical protein